MKLLIPFVFVVATIIGVAVQLMPSRLDRELLQIEQEREAALKKIEARYTAEIARIEEESAIFKAKLDTHVKRAEDCVRRAVLARLKAPATAQFGPIEFRNPSWIPNTGINLEQWVGYGYVDSQNPFGALLRQRYEVCIFVNKETRRWEILDSVSFFDN